MCYVCIIIAERDTRTNLAIVSNGLHFPGYYDILQPSVGNDWTAFARVIWTASRRPRDEVTGQEVDNSLSLPLSFSLWLSRRGGARSIRGDERV